jgi:protein involved in polysaccharide export with SLBB domain
MVGNNKVIFRGKHIPVFYCGLIIFFIFAFSAYSQNQTKSDIDKLNSYSSNLAAFQAQKANKMILDKKINPATYVLGPGDIVSIFAWGGFSGQFQLTVSPEGMLLVPELGPIDLAGLTLAEAQTKVSNEMRLKYRNVESIISLIELRTFKVFIGGAIMTPGAYPATPVTRVSEVIALAGGLIQLPEESNGTRLHSVLLYYSPLAISSKRNIKVFRQNGDTLTADILKFNIAGDASNDPYLSDGDEVFIPVREENINLYGIFGAVKNAGYFEYSKKDSLADLINLAHGTTMDADSQQVEIVRFNPDNKTIQSIVCDLRSPGWNIPLFSDDRIYIKPIQGYHRKYQVNLYGEFKYPGSYAIIEDSTTLSEIVAKAGGFTDIASLDEAEMTRMSAEEVVDPEFERLKKMNIADMSETEYEYFKIKSRSKIGRVAVDFNKLFIQNDRNSDILLRDNDWINVPRKRQVISVSGEVANPGFMTYVPGKDYTYYIKMAGGFSERAGGSSIAIIKAATGEWKNARKGKGLEPGDTVWIPEKKKHNYVAIIKDVAVFVGNLATVFLVIKQATGK